MTTVTIIPHTHGTKRLIPIKAAPYSEGVNPCHGCVYDSGANGQTDEQLLGCLQAPPCMENGQRYVFVEDEA